MVLLHKLPQHANPLALVSLKVKPIVLALFDLVKIVVKGFLGQIHLFGSLLQGNFLIFADAAPFGHFFKHLPDRAVIYPLLLADRLRLLGERGVDADYFDRDDREGHEILAQVHVVLEGVHAPEDEIL